MSQALHNGQSVPLRDVAAVFTKLGLIGFGGPAAHLALMADETVQRRGWLSHDDFLDLLGMTNLIPGPNSTEMAIHIGHRVAGWPGLLVAGSCFILPAVAIVSLMAWAYVQFGTLPQVNGLLYGIKPVIIAIVLQALWQLGRAAIKNRGLAVLGGIAVGLALLGANELAVLAAAGAGWALLARSRSAPRGLMAGALLAAPLTTAGLTPFGLWPLFLFFLKVGSVLFGSGYVLLAFFERQLVQQWGWLTQAQLLDAVAVGQVTPGPVFTTATFIGYLLGGLPGAIVATVGIFLPAFVFVAISGPLIPRLRRSPLTAPVLDGVNVASAALMVAVSAHLGRAAVVDGPTALIAMASAFLLLRFKVNATWLILGGAVIGLSYGSVALAR